MYEYVIAQLQKAKGTWPVIAKKTGMSVRTIQKIASGEIASPRVHSIQTLHDYFRNGKKK